MEKLHRIVAFVPTMNAEQAQPFYERQLGLRFVKDDGFALTFDLDGIPLRVARVKDHTPAPFTILGWEVADVAATVEALRDRGVRFERYPFLQQDDHEVWTAPSGDRVAWFKDPDGNTLSLS